MKPTSTQVAIAVIGALGVLGASWLTGSAAANSQLNAVDTKVQVLAERQALQYNQLKDSVTTIQQDVKEILRAVK